MVECANPVKPASHELAQHSADLEIFPEVEVFMPRRNCSL
jgi:hypothetical protein